MGFLIESVQIFIRFAMMLTGFVRIPVFIRVVRILTDIVKILIGLVRI